MSIFLGYICLFYPTAVICVFSLRFFSLEFIYDDAGAYFNETLLPNIVLVLVILFIVGYLVYKILKPFDTIITRLKKDGIKPTEKEKSNCLTCYKKLTIVTICANLLGFFIGQIVMIIIGVMNGTPFYLSRALFIVLQATGFGAISAITTIFGMNIRLAPMREELNIQSLDNNNSAKKTSVTNSIIIVCLCIFLFVAVNFLSVPYGIIFNINQTGVIPTNIMLTAMHKVLLSIVLIIPFCILPVYFTLKAIKDRIKETTHLIQDITKEGDLHSRINITFIDDFGVLTSSINSLMSEFSSIINEIKKGTHGVSESANNISEATKNASSELSGISQTFSNLNNTSTEQERSVVHAEEYINNLANDIVTVQKHVLEQASSLQETSASITEMTGNISSVAQIAQKAEQVSETLSKTSTLGNQAITKAIVSMNEIQAASKQVQEMVRIISQIASQTNLLSMNAAIEAAHAGVYGQGFAVVANEVRTLANSSAESTKKIQQYIKTMIEKINAGAESITTAGTSFKTIENNVAQNNDLVRTISNAMNEQRIGAEETMTSTQDVVNAIQSIKELTQKESENAQNVTKFMQDVVKSSRASVSTVLDSSISAANLNDAIAKVSELAISNMESVTKMQELITKYSTI